MKWILIYYESLNYIVNQLSAKSYIWNTNLNNEPFFNKLFDILSSITENISKKLWLVIWGYRMIFLKLYVSNASNLNNGSIVTLLISLKLCP